MTIQSIFRGLLLVAVTLLQAKEAASDGTTETNPKKRGLIFKPFDDPSLTCPDGSRAGVYIENKYGEGEGSSSGHGVKRNKLRHVINIQGGGVCSTPENCEHRFEEKFYSFTSTFNPSFMNGDTFLSPDPEQNPAMHDYTRFFVPYCTQDFFMGKGVVEGAREDFPSNGDAVFKAALETWVRWVEEDLEDQSSNQTQLLENVVIVGISAGAIGLMNHVGLVRDMIGNRTSQLRHIWDGAGVLSDREYPVHEFGTFGDTYVDHQEFPFCSSQHTYSQLYRQASVLPCCLSIHCMMRHHPDLTYFHLQDTDSNEELLILDSAYDYLELLAGSSIGNKGYYDLTGAQRQRVTDTAFMYETAGGRRARAKETVAVAKSSVVDGSIEFVQNETNSRVLWLHSSCLSHTFLVPSYEFVQISCEGEKNSKEKFDTYCNSNGIGRRIDVKDLEFGITVWKTTDTWRQVEFGQKTLRQIINIFVALDQPQVFPVDSWYANETIDLRIDCYGMGCLAAEYPDDDVPSCFATIEIHSDFEEISIGWIIPCYFFLSYFLLTTIRRCTVYSKLAKMEEHARMYKDCSIMNAALSDANSQTNQKQCNLHLRGITIRSHGFGDCTTLVESVDLDLKSSSITALCGRSGAGKSTLLRALSQLKVGLDVSMKKGQDSLSSMSKGYLRQGDNLAWSNIRPCDLVLLNARIYGAAESRTYELYNLLEKLFHRGAKDSNFNPFFDTVVGNLSGGQRRLVSIVSTLLRDTSLLLLDEPLSGLDSISSMQLMEALRVIVDAHSITAVMVVHQPSEQLMQHFDHLVVMNAGKIAYQGPVTSTGSDEDIIGAHLQESVDQSKLSLEDEISSHRQSSKGFYMRSSWMNQLSELSGAFDPKDETVDEEEVVTSQEAGAGLAMKTKHDRFNNVETATQEKHQIKQGILAGFLQGHYIGQRLQVNNGFELMDIALVATIYSIAALMVQLEESHVMQVMLMVLVMIVVPSIALSAKTVQAGKMWRDHVLEIDDGLVQPHCGFGFGTVPFTYQMPFFGIILGTALSYLILGWSFDTYMIQVLINLLCFTAIIQCGRVISIVTGGEPGTVVKWMSVLIMFNVLFSSVPIASWKMPPGLRWLCYLSVNFWGISAAMMTHLDPDGVYDNAELCSDTFSCIITDGRLAAHYLGFAQQTNQNLSFGVLLSYAMAAFAAEGVVVEMIRSNSIFSPKK